MKNPKHPPPTPGSDPEILMALSQAIKPYPLSDDRKDALRARLLSRLNPPPPPGTHTFRASDMEWRVIFPLIEAKILYRDCERNHQTALWRLQPGAVFPRHGHTVEEECWVLEGEIQIGEHWVRKGDMHISPVGKIHPQIRSAGGALLLIRGEIVEPLLAR